MVSKPERSCFGCGRKTDKRALIRLALTKEGQVLVDLEQRAGGRGLYVCPKTDCFKRAAKRKLPQPVRRRVSGPALTRVFQQALAEAGQI
ncbi:MAG: YlxR family protein [Deltaproteobacteria bacterium]|nr:YlxR family protein [Deltaproteobacteria bacterium]